MQPFAYHRAGTVAEACHQAAQPETAILAGGTELLNWMRLGIATPSRLVDIRRLADLSGIARQPDGALWIGALTTLNAIAADQTVARDAPVLQQAAVKAASAQLRNLATIGGNPLQRTRCAYFRQDDKVPCNKRQPGTGCSALHGFNDKHAIFGWSEACVATHPADPPVALAALDALAVTRSSNGRRRIPVRDLILLPTAAGPEIDTMLAVGEIITGFEIPAPAPGSAYVKVRERESYEYATVSCAAAIELESGSITRARLALGSVAHRPWRLDEAERRLVGTRPGSREAARAIAASFADARPLAMNAYKVELARNTAVRALELASAAA